MAPVLAGGANKPIEAGKLQQLIERCQAATADSVDAAVFRCAAKAADDGRILVCLHEASTIAQGNPYSKAEERRRGRRSAEVELQLGKIKTNAKAAFNTDASYPAVTAPLTPSTPCCELPGKRCTPRPADWATSPWQALDFQLDEPFDFQYSYAGTATSYVATAVGDPGCTGRPVTYTLEGSVSNGNPSSTLTLPPPR